MLGRITYWNNPRGFGFITVESTDGNGTFQQQYFFHHSNFKNGEIPRIGGIVVFSLGDPVAVGKKDQAVRVRYAAPRDFAKQNANLAGVARGIDALKEVL